jgi:hypothetical protein
MYLVKIDAQGDKICPKTDGGERADVCFSVSQTSDNGYILGGYTYYGGMYLVKTDAQGDVMWTKTFGRGLNDYCYSVSQTSDGGYILGGYTRQSCVGWSDMYLVKTNAQGDSMWTRGYNADSADYCESVFQTSDGGYILGGYSHSYGGGSSCIYLAKTDAQGDTMWTKIFRRNNGIYCKSVLQTSDGGFLLGGADNNDMYLVKTDALGDTIWTKTYGGNDNDRCYSVSQASDGGFILGGYTIYNSKHPPFECSGQYDRYAGWIVHCGDSTDIYLVKTAPASSTTISNFPSSTPTPSQTALHVSVSNQISISFTLNQPENVHISMHSMSGSKVADITNKQFSGGTHKIMLEKHDFATGVYLINMNTKAGSQTQSITLLK